MVKRKFGYIPDPFDERDFLYQKRLTALSGSVDLRQYCSPVRDQGSLGSCTGFAIATGMREFLQNKAVTTPPVVSWWSWLTRWFTWAKVNLAFTVLSPLFLYYEERVLGGMITSDTGAFPRDGFKTLLNVGCSPETDWRYDPANFAKRPSDIAYKNAANFKIASYHRLYTLTDLLTCLNDGNGAVLGFLVYGSFYQVDATGRMPMPKAGEALLGGHAVFACGYAFDNTYEGGGYILIKNSWGEAWGDKGYFRMPFAFVTPINVLDMWTAIL